MTMYRTEIYQKPAKNNKYAYSTMNFEELQKQSMMSQLYDQVSQYYRDLIDSNKASIDFGYIKDDNGNEMAHVGIYDNETGEQILWQAFNKD